MTGNKIRHIKIITKRIENKSKFKKVHGGGGFERTPFHISQQSLK